MRLPALLFDLDGTLVDSAADIARALSIVSQSRGGPIIDPAVVRPLVSLGAAVLVRRALGAVAGDEIDDLARFRKALGSLAPDKTIIFDGVNTTLTALADAGFPMAIVTNKPEALSRHLLHGLALDHFFAAIVGGDSAKLPKPDRAPLDLARQQMGMAGDAGVMIGDSSVDAAAARAGGVPFVLYERGYGAKECATGDIARRFDHFADLPRILTELSIEIDRAASR